MVDQPRRDAWRRAVDREIVGPVQGAASGVDRAGHSGQADSTDVAAGHAAQDAAQADLESAEQPGPEAWLPLAEPWAPGAVVRALPLEVAPRREQVSLEPQEQSVERQELKPLGLLALPEAALQELERRARLPASERERAASQLAEPEPRALGARQWELEERAVLPDAGEQLWRRPP